MNVQDSDYDKALVDVLLAVPSNGGVPLFDQGLIRAFLFTQVSRNVRVIHRIHL